MVEFAIAIADPIGLGTLDGSNSINITEIAGGPQSDFLEVLAGNGKFIESAIKALRPIEQWSISYELLDAAAFTLAFGAAVNADYLVTAFSASCAPETYPTVNVTVMKPSAANMIKAYFGAAVSVTLAGGLGIVNKFGATAASAFVSSQASIEMLTAEAMGETSGDFLEEGILHYGFKTSASMEAYGVISVPGTAHATDTPIRRSRDGWRIYGSSWWKYEDAA